MALNSLLRDSNLCAVSLLDALSREPGDDLSFRLDSAAALVQTPVGDPAEDERIELLGGIAGELRELAASGGLDRANVYIGLLRHLARPASGARAISAGASFQ